MTECSSAGDPLIHRKVCADENEVGECFTCDRFIHKYDVYTLVLIRKFLEPIDEAAHCKTVGICEVCSNNIATFSTAWKEKVRNVKKTKA